MTHSFPPIINKDSRILILGSLPGTKSLEMQQYYADPRNQFWYILYAVFGYEAPDSDYEKRAAFILSHGLALWDVVHSAERNGALDKNIKNATANDIPGLLRDYPKLGRIICGGRKSAELFRRFFPEIGIKTIYVPSTSPIQGRYVKPVEEKLALWRSAILEI